MNSDWFPQRTIYLLFWVVTVSQFILGFLLYGTTGTRQGLPNPDKLLKTNQFQHVLMCIVFKPQFIRYFHLPMHTMGWKCRINK